MLGDLGRIPFCDGVGGKAKVGAGRGGGGIETRFCGIAEDTKMREACKLAAARVFETPFDPAPNAEDDDNLRPLIPLPLRCSELFALRSEEDLLGGLSP